MPVRTGRRAHAWLLPPSLDDRVAVDHPVRLVALLVESLPAAEGQALGIEPPGAARGAPASAPRVLVGVWLDGFMIGVRSARKLAGQGLAASGCPSSG